MEQSDSGKHHCHTVFVAAFDHGIIPHGTAGLCDILHAALMHPLHIVGEGEEGVGAHCHILHPVKPCSLFFSGKYRRLYLKELWHYLCQLCQVRPQTEDS